MDEHIHEILLNLSNEMDRTGRGLIGLGRRRRVGRPKKRGGCDYQEEGSGIYGTGIYGTGLIGGRKNPLFNISKYNKALKKGLSVSEAKEAARR
jgi:hypothetical protein